MLMMDGLGRVENHHIIKQRNKLFGFNLENPNNILKQKKKLATHIIDVFQLVVMYHYIDQPSLSHQTRVY